MRRDTMWPKNHYPVNGTSADSKVASHYNHSETWIIINPHLALKIYVNPVNTRLMQI